MGYHEREKEIMSLLTEGETVSVKQLANQLYVSEPTVRRDLSILARKGLVIRTHGGVMPKATAADEVFAISLREQVHGTAKMIMGRTAASMVKDGMVIMMDGSTSVYAMLPHLTEYKDLIVITNGAKTALTLGRLGIKNYCTGGQMINDTMAYVGRHAEQMIGELNADMLFFSARGLSEEGDFSDSSIEENNLRRAMMKRARRRVMLLDSSKVGQRYMDVLCRMEDVNEVICEKALPLELANRLDK